MRRPPPNFKVERRTARRPTTRQPNFADSDVALLDAPAMDDVPARDIRDDEYDTEDRSSRAREQAEKLFSPRQRELPVDSTDIFPPNPPKAEPVVEAKAPEPVAPAEPARRILQSVTWVDPVEERLREDAERRGRRKLGRPRKVRPEGEVAPPPKTLKRRSVEIIAAQAAAPIAPVLRASPSRINPSQIVALSYRKRHPEPRILYNKWGYSQILRDAQHMPRNVAEIVLKPGQTWRRRMPVATWR